jgi:hypothetical protein
MNSTAQRWQSAVRLAPTEASLVGVVAEYLEGIPAGALASLPRSARPTAIRGPEDIVALTLQVAREELMFSGDVETTALLREMLAVLTEAAGRLASMSIDTRPPQTRP